MYQVTISGGDRPTRRYDLHALPIGGTMAHLLSPSELFRELKLLKVPGISANFGWYELALKYAEHLEATPPEPAVDRRGAA
jgi:hypothetical protein